MLAHDGDYQQQNRVMFPKIVIDYTDSFLDPSFVVTSSSDNYTSWKDQVTNGKESMGHKYAALDDLWVLGQDFALAPGTSGEANFTQMGWASGQRANASGATNQYLDISFSSRSVSSYKVIFDDKRNEYAEDFTVKLLDGVTVLETKVVTGNTLITVSDAFTTVPNVDNVQIDITKWSQGLTVLKICSFSTAVRKTYEGDTIKSMNVLEQREVSNQNSIPYGNLAATSLTFSLVDTEGTFNINNTGSELFGIINPNVRVSASVGMKYSGGIDEIPIFNGWINTWDTPDTGIEVSASARDILEIFRQTKIETSAVQLNKTFYEWFEYLLNNAGRSSGSYIIDTALQGTDYIVPVGWFDRITHREALELLTRASASVAYQDRNSIIQIQSITSLSGSSVATFNRSIYQDKNNQPKFDSFANRIIVESTSLELSASQTVYETNTSEPFIIPELSNMTITVLYTAKPAVNQVTTLTQDTAGVSIVTQTHYSWGSTIELNSTRFSPQEFWIKIDAQVYVSQGINPVEVIDSDSIARHGNKAFNWGTTPFLQKRSLATIIANNTLSSFKDPQKDVTLSLNTAGDPTIELGDKISITDLYSTEDYFVTETSIDFTGGLSSTMKGRK